MRSLALVSTLALLTMVAAPLGAATTRNDDACDIGLFPAATLLLPYFEVAIGANETETTVFTVTNTGPAPQAARVTLWTTFAYPVISFNLYLTGYDVQKIDLADVIERGLIAPDTDMGSDTSPAGELSDDDNPRLDETTCASLPQALPAVVIQRMQSAFTAGRIPPMQDAPACINIGLPNAQAIGYATVDVVSVCTPTMPNEPSYFTHEIAFDNVLIGDYVQVSGDQQFAQGNPMVHIRAIPEGGSAATRRKTNLPRTFYSRLQPAATRTLDARQPLPSTFGARYIESGTFATSLKIWRETRATASTACNAYPTLSLMPYEAVRFDEEENLEGYEYFPMTPPVPEHRPLPPALRARTDDESFFPPNTMGTVAGWMYLNLHNDQRNTEFASQNWVVASMRAENRFSVDVDAVALGNGCSAPARESTANRGPHIIGPAPNPTP